MDANVKQIFPARLVAIRKERNMSQEEFSKKTGISRVGLIRYESGDRLPNVEILKRITDALNISADYLIGNTDSESLDVESKAISRKTGLNDTALNKLDENKGYPISFDASVYEYFKPKWKTTEQKKAQKLINLLLADSSKNLLESLNDYIFSKGGDVKEQTITLDGKTEKIDKQEYFTLLLLRIQRELMRIKDEVNKN